MGNLKDYLSDDSINNLFSVFSNVFIIEVDQYAVLSGSGKMVGQVLLKIESKKDYIIPGDHVEFFISKSKWKSNLKDDKQLVVINSRWVKPYYHDPKLEVMVPVLKSKAGASNDDRIYYKDFEIMKLTYLQYQAKKLLLDFGDKYTYGQMEAYFNMRRRFQETGNYYKSLNETSKFYYAEHKFIKDVIFPEINNAIKKYKKQWNELLIKQYKRNENQRRIDEFVNHKKKESKKSNKKVIEFPSNFEF